MSEIRLPTSPLPHCIGGKVKHCDVDDLLHHDAYIKMKEEYTRFLHKQLVYREIG